MIWHRWSPPFRLTALSLVLTALLAFLLGWTLDAQLQGIGLAGWVTVASGISILYANLFLLTRRSWRQLAKREEQRQLSETVECIASALGSAIELRDKETPGHTQRVTELSLQLASRAGLHTEELQNLRNGCLLHDVGKLGIPEAILLKPTPLSDEERKLMQEHSELAYRMFRSVPYLAPAMDVPYCHHERWDGSGYPRRLRGEEIPLAARLFAVVDVFDALTSERPYRQAWTTDYAIQYIQGKSGKHFDPHIVDLFQNAMRMLPLPHR